MTGSGDSEPPDKDSDAKEAFADLLGDAKRLDKGPARVAPPKSIRRPAGTKSPGGTAPGFRWPDSQDSWTAAAEGVSNQVLLALKRGEPAPEERIDLHGVRRDAAPRILSKRLESARAQGLTCVVVIHGQGLGSAGGDAVLREGLPGWLTGARSAPHVLAFTPAPDRLGGLGATLVLLRRGA